MMMAFLALSVLGTAGAVIFGLAAYLSDQKAAPADTWSVTPRAVAMNQAERMRAGAERDRVRCQARAWTYIAAGCWLWATAYGATVATTGTRLSSLVPGALVFAWLGHLLIATTVLFAFLDRRRRTERYNEHVARASRVEQIVKSSLQPTDVPLTVDQQLEEWASDDDLSVFVLHGAGEFSVTYQGKLLLETKGIGGYTLYAPDWHLGPLDSVSVVRGMALNLHHWTEAQWQPGNGVFGASCRFSKRDFICMRGDDGKAIVNPAIVGTLTIRVDDPFETMHFLP